MRIIRKAKQHHHETGLRTHHYFFHKKNCRDVLPTEAVISKRAHEITTQKIDESMYVLDEDMIV